MSGVGSGGAGVSVPRAGPRIAPQPHVSSSAEAVSSDSSFLCMVSTSCPSGARRVYGRAAPFAGI